MKWRNSILVAITLAVLAGAGCDTVNRSGATNRFSEFDDPYYTTKVVAPMTDDLLAARLTELLKTDPATRNADIKVTVIGRRARLSGFVHNAAVKLRAAELIQQADGVIDVENRLILQYHVNFKAGPIITARMYL